LLGCGRTQSTISVTPTTPPNARVEYETPFAIGALPEAGLSDREIIKREHRLALHLPMASAARARGDITVIRDQLDELLYAFQCSLDRKSASYCKLGMAVLTVHVKGLKDIERRDAGVSSSVALAMISPASSTMIFMRRLQRNAPKC
jgi:hypothetical protein